ncbi:unnamed protein product [Cyberlindnera jadinii]|uniref:Actin-like ATPase domain-containing protein n=1 Tax=Cyberlindnera jadinii (strain ATCC 18201 / CBS 1600 / BCRC 20928 / JCM 3617 / NBRC 0987 / NRRL Y-1542) TaxID=983966 RepID=A0A0H5C576_CYBJN|nr:unnamed protein product [Cyberlindnera jadinii]
MGQQYYPIIFDVGSRFVRAGFAGDACAIVRRRTNVYDLTDAQLTVRSDDACEGERGQEPPQFLWTESMARVDPYRLECLLERIIHDVYENDLLVDPKRCKVLMLEPVMLPLPLKRALTRVILFHMHAQSIRFLPASVMSVLASGATSGLVIDLGWNVTTVTPVFDLRQLYIYSKQTLRASRRIHNDIRKKLANLGLDTTFEFVEQFLIECCYCGIGNHGTGDFTFNNSTIPQELRYQSIEEILFPDEQDGTDDDDSQTLCSLVEQVIKEVDIDLRTPLSSNIIIVGGLSNIPGIKTRIIYEINKRTKASGIKSLGPWQGASLYCTTSLMTSSTSTRIKNSGELTREKYISGQEVLLDWTDTLFSKCSI